METFYKGDLVIITSVDLNGFTGRNYHPSEEDVGLTCEVVRVEVFDDEEPFLEPHDCDYTCITVLTYGDTPRFLELIDHEVSKSTRFDRERDWFKTAVRREVLTHSQTC